MSLPNSRPGIEGKRVGHGVIDRRSFLQAAGATAVAAGATPLWAQAPASSPASSEPESLVKVFYESLNEKQKNAVCFDWNYRQQQRGLLRTRVSANWSVTRPAVNGDFYTDDQRDLVRQIFEGIIHPDWHARYDKQMKDDSGGFGRHQHVAVFGQPGEGKFQFLLTGRHMTLRCDGNSADHVAFGGPIFYGHAAGSFREKPDHPGNVFWPQAIAANSLYKMLDGKQRKMALVKDGMPPQNQIGFPGKDAELPGIAVTELSSDQKEHLHKVLGKLLEPFRQSDRDEALACLKSFGGLSACSLAYYAEHDLGGDQVWDNWCLQGPSFVWNFRGAPHVHVWVNVANSPKVETNAI